MPASMMRAEAGGSAKVKGKSIATVERGDPGQHANPRADHDAGEAEQEVLPARRRVQAERQIVEQLHGLFSPSSVCRIFLDGPVQIRPRTSLEKAPAVSCLTDLPDGDDTATGAAAVIVPSPLAFSGSSFPQMLIHSRLSG